MIGPYRACAGAIVCLLVATAPARTGAHSDSSHPVTRVIGLKGEGKVTRDSSGIPHIQATNEHDVLFLQGYTHAQDRLFQMDASRRQADGTLAELLGSSALASDVQMRTFGLRRAAERSLPILSPATRRALSAYADGVNAYVARNPLPPEYAALEITRFRTWTEVDSISILKLIVFSISFDLTDLARTSLLSQYQAAGAAQGFDGSALFFDDVNRVAPFDPTATIPDATGRSSSGDKSVSAAPVVSGPVRTDAATLALARQYEAQIRKMPLLQSVLKDTANDRGSNEFIVAGSRSLTGLPLLANDPHLPLTAPSIWYENQISAPGFSAIGASFAGAPFVILGNNERIAWTATNHLVDITDVYQERIVADPRSPSGLSTEYRGDLEPVLALPQTFRANTIGDGVQDSVEVVPAGAGIPATIFIVPRRNNGPIISMDQAAERAISVQYAGFSGTREIQAFRGFNRAGNLSEFRKALQSFDVGSQNFMFADTSGNIAYFTAGEVPLREDLQAGAPDGVPPFLVRNGQGGNEWLQPPPGHDPNRALPFAILPASEMPQVVNPPRGVIVNANNDPTGNNRDNDMLNVLRPGGGIRYIAGYGFDSGVRAGRIEALFAPFVAGDQKLGLEDLQRFQADVVMREAQYFTPFVVQALASARRPGAPAALAEFAADARVVEAVGRLADWDHSAPTGIAEGFDASDKDGEGDEPPQAEIDNSVAATIYAVFRNQLIKQILTDTLSRRGLPVPRGREEQIIAVKNLFDRFSERAGVGRSGIDFFEVPGVAAADDRRDTIVLRSLSSALTLLASPAFEAAFNRSTNQSDYRWGRLHRVVFAHPMGGPFNTPPAGGAFPQPLPNLPGVSIDGGLYTVDVGNHPFDRDESNGFMVTFGVSRRYVARITPKGVESFSIIPGGASGVPGDPFSVNLLPLWLTNETVPLIDDIDSSPGRIVRFETFRPASRRGHKTGR